MGKTYSSDFRECVVVQVKAGHSRREVARRFGVSPSFVIKLMARLENGESSAPAKRRATVRLWQTRFGDGGAYRPC